MDHCGERPQATCSAEISRPLARGGVLGWDQRVTMPPLGTEGRAESLATIGRIIHEPFVSTTSGGCSTSCEPHEESLPYDSDDASLIRVTRRDWEKARRVPTELEVEMTRAAARGHHAWVEARRNVDFASFLPYLRENVELKRRYAECFEWDDSPVHAAARRLRAGHDDGRGEQRCSACSAPLLTELVRLRPRWTPRSCTRTSRSTTSAPSASA